MKGVCSLLADAASAVADISALIWRIRRSSVDGCITFSLDHGPTRGFLISVHRKSATDKIANTGCDRLLAFHQSMIRKRGYRFSLATNAERVCAEIMLKSEDDRRA
jgi:hypothetical protein